MEDTKSTCGFLLGQLQLHLDSLCSENEALVAQNCRLSAALQEQGGEALVVENCRLSVALQEQGGETAATQTQRLARSPQKQGDTMIDHPMSALVLAEGEAGSIQLHETQPSPSIFGARGRPQGEEVGIDLGEICVYSASEEEPAQEGAVVRVDSRDGLANREFYTEFRRLCSEHKNTISAPEIFDMLSLQASQRAKARGSWMGQKRRLSWSSHQDESTQPEAIAQYSSALRAINDQIAARRPEDGIDPNYKDELQANTYIMIFRAPDVVSSFGLRPESMATLNEICQIIINHLLARDIAQMTNVEATLIYESQSTTCKEKSLAVLDTLAGIMIVLNIVVITCSLDVRPDWIGWDRIEALFTGFFLLEIGLRMSATGPKEHLTGAEASWNAFDMAVVSYGLIDIALRSADVLAKETVSHMTTTRILRLLRVVKMVRVLRLRQMKELRLIVFGLFAGLRVILWAFVFLFVFILVIGITTKQMLNIYPLDIQFQAEMFGSVPRCMLTVFRCYVADECSTFGGIPLIPVFVEHFGAFFAICYVSCYVFLGFGLFNLIMATIVESTMEAGKIDDVKRRRERQKQHLALAHAVQDLVKALCSVGEDDAEQNYGLRDVGERLLEQLGGASEEPPRLLSSRISSKKFLSLVECPKIQSLFERLGVNLMDPTHYVEAFDANEDGMLSIAELVRGLLKLRGSVEKADVVATLTVARDLQKSVKHVETMLSRGGLQTQSSSQPENKLDRFAASLYSVYRPKELSRTR